MVAGTQVDVRHSSVVAVFSSRGPNMVTVTPEILKPDMIVPGLNILVAWTDKAVPTSLAAGTRRVGINNNSSTSMSCPHVSGHMLGAIDHGSTAYAGYSMIAALAGVRVCREQDLLRGQTQLPVLLGGLLDGGGTRPP
jgi:hypothetical protein